MASLAPQPKFRAFTAGALGAPVMPLVGGRVFTYEAGTTTPKPTYKDSAQVTLNQNPIVLDNHGEADIWFAAGAYKVILTDASGVQQWAVDNVKSLDQILGEAKAYTDTQLAAALGNLGGTLPYTIIQGDGVADKTAELAVANAIGKPIFFNGVARFLFASTVTAPIIDTGARIFTDDSLITVDNGLFVRPEWWGTSQDALFRAYTALPFDGGEILLAERVYDVTKFFYGFGSAGVAVTKPNVIIRGAKMPILQSDCKALTGGSIIRGMFLGYADNLELRDVGVDYGYTVLQARKAGIAAAGVTEAALFTYPDDASMNAGSLKRGLRLHNVIGLCAAPDTPGHGVLIEGYSDVTCTGEVQGVYSINAVVIKAQVVKAEQLTGYMSNASEVIIKSAAGTTARAMEVQIGSIYADHYGPNGWSPYITPASNVGANLKFHAEGASIDRVQIASASLIGANAAVLWQSDGAFDISNVSIAQLTTDGNAAGGMTCALNAASKFNRCGIAKWTARNAPFAGNFDWVNTGTVYSLFEVGHLYAVGMTYAAICTSNNPYIAFGTITTEACNAVWRILGSPRIQVGNLQRGTTAILYSTADSGQQPTFGTGWGQLAGSVSPFGADFMGGGVALRGQITPGSSNVCATLPPPWRPVSDKQFMAQGRNGSTIAAVPVTVGVNGSVTVNAVAGGTTNVTTHLSLDGITYNLVS